jgi:hypothetical protein
MRQWFGLRNNPTFFVWGGRCNPPTVVDMSGTPDKEIVLFLFEIFSRISYLMKQKDSNVYQQPIPFFYLGQPTVLRVAFLFCTAVIREKYSLN